MKNILPLHASGLIAVMILMTGCSSLIVPKPQATPVTDGTASGLHLQQVATGLSYPTAVSHAGDGSRRLYITEQHGTVRVVDHGRLLPIDFLDITAQVGCCGEQGLLSIAFHPDFAVNGYFYVYFTDKDGDAVIARYHSTPGSNRADPDSEKLILKIRQPTPIHNGGQLQFGPDGYLYIGTGDGGSFSKGGDGSGNDPENHAQRLNTLLGKILRIDVDYNHPYAIPPTNPYVNSVGARKEIWARGLKNPWRFAFDRASGDLYIADVGRDRWEEINFQPHDSPGGENYGWRLMEGPACFYLSHDCNPHGALTLPAIQYSHKQGCAVIGGYVYRGRRIPVLVGQYLYADFCTGKIWAATRDKDDHWSSRLLLDSDYLITSFGEDDEGELYITHRDKQDGAVYRLVTADDED
jgi:glucose/arabinose dehydrogenase